MTKVSPGGPIRAFFEYIAAHRQETVPQWLLKIKSQVSGLAVEHLRKFLKTFLEELVTVLDVSSLEARRCIQSLVITYIIGMLGKEPEKPSDWARSKEVANRHGDCRDCFEMNSFLMDPTRQQHILYQWVERDYHLEDQFQDFRYFEVEEVNHRPIKVTKTLKWWEEKHREWEACTSAELEKLRRQPQAGFKYCLSDQDEEIIDFQTLTLLTDDSSEHSDKGGCRGSKSTVPQKRPLDDM